MKAVLSVSYTHLDDAAKRLLQLVIEVANGKETQTEKRGYRSISIFKDGVVL